MYPLKPTPEGELVIDISTEVYGGVYIDGERRTSVFDAEKWEYIRDEEPTFIYFHEHVKVYESETNYIIEDWLYQVRIEVSKCSAELISRPDADECYVGDYLTAC